MSQLGRNRQSTVHQPDPLAHTYQSQPGLCAWASGGEAGAVVRDVQLQQSLCCAENDVDLPSTSVCHSILQAFLRDSIEARSAEWIQLRIIREIFEMDVCP